MGTSHVAPCECCVVSLSFVSVPHLVSQITSGNISCPIPDSADPELARIALQLLTLNPVDRLSVTDLHASEAIQRRLKDWRRTGLSCSVAVMVRQWGASFACTPPRAQ